MAEKTPVRVVFNASNVATGLAEFQSGDAVGVSFGGTGLNAIGSAGQIIKVNAAGNALEFGAEGDLSITNLVAPTNSDLTLTTSGTGNIVLDAITFRGTTISSADSTIININEGVVIDGTLNTSGQATLSGLAYPTSDGTVGQFLKTDGSGTLAFADLSLGDLTIIGSTISVPSNADFILDPSGTGAIKLNANTDITGNLTVTGTLDLSDSNFTNVGSLQLDSIAGDGDTNTSITFSGSDVITIATGGAGRLTVGDGALSPVTDSQIDLGTSSLYYKDAYIDSITTTGNVSIGGNLDVTGTLDLSDSNFTNVGSLQLDSIAGDGDTNTSITFSGSDVITIATGGSGRLTIGDGALAPVTDNEIDLGTSSLEFKDAFFNGTVTSDAFAGPLTGDVTGTADVATVATTVTVSDNESTNESNVILFAAGAAGSGNLGVEADGNMTYNPSTGIITATGFAGALTGNVTGNVTGTAATVTGAAQTNITSVGTLTALQVDNININGNAITSTAGTDLTITPVAGQQIVLDGTIVVDAGVVTGATSITSDTFVGALTGNATGTAATVTGAAQTNITSVGTLTTLTVDNVIINGTTIGHTSDTDAIAIGSDGDVTLTQDLELQHDGAILSFGADDDIAITHVHDTGLLLTDSGGTPTLQLHDSNESVSSDGTNLILTSGGTAFKMPTADGSAGQALITDGAGNLSFDTVTTTASDDSRAVIKNNKKVNTSAKTVDYFQETAFDMAWYFMALNDLTNDHTSGSVFTVCHNNTAAFISGARGGSSGTGNLLPTTTADMAADQVRVKITGPSADGKVSFYKIPISTANTADATSGVAVTTSNTDVDSASESIDTFAHASFRAAKYTILIDDDAKTETGVTEALVVHDGTNAFVAQFGTVNTGNNDMIVLSAAISGDNVVVSAAGLTPNLKVKTHKILLSDSMTAIENANQKTIGATTVSSTATAFDSFDLDDTTAAVYYVVGKNATEDEYSVQEVYMCGDVGEAGLAQGPFVSTKGTTQLEFAGDYIGTADNTVQMTISSTSGASTVVNAYRISCLAEE